MKPFDFINDASYTKKNLMKGSENDQLAEKAYNPWITNIAFSQHPDSILHANLMNMYHHLDNRSQYTYYINSLRAKKRFAKWPKKADNEDLDMVCEMYGCNLNVGKEYLTLLTREQLDTMREQQKTGGIQNGRRKKSSGGDPTER